MIDAVRAFAKSGRPIYAECGGLMYLTDAIRTLSGQTWPMAGLIAGVAVMSERLQALGYVEVATRAPSILGGAGRNFAVINFATRRLKTTRSMHPLYSVQPKWGAPFVEGYASANLVASYVHAHWASNPAIPEAFVKACMESRKAA